MAGKPIRKRASRAIGATIRDVAAKAGVSVATVSRTLSGTGPVRDATSRRVMRVARAMRYVPHAAAQSLSRRRSQTIGLVLPDLYGEFFSEVIRGVDRAARQRKYHVLVSGSHSDTGEMAAVLGALRGRVDGLIVMSPDVDPAALIRNAPSAIPVVLLNSATRGRHTIQIDNYSGARAMLAHLIALGHTNIAFISGPERNIDAAERRRGCRDATRRTAAKCTTFPGEFTEESGYEATKQILRSVPRPTAIFAANDAMAIGALHALREKAVRVPEQMALGGFDDIPLARFVSPPLTTVRVQIAELGARAVEMLLSTLENDSPSVESAVIPTSLVIRESCGASERRTANG